MTENEDDKVAYEERLQRRLRILKEQFEAGKIKIAPGLKVADSLRAVRNKPDGSVDLSTVDALVRSMALATEYFHDREQLKKEFPLLETQQTYFEFLHRNFGQFYAVMRARNLTPHDAGIAFSRDAEVAAQVADQIPEFLDVIEEFWRCSGDAAQAHVEDMHGSLKGVFGGDLFPSHEQNIASRCGIYLDTIVLPDPFLRSKDLFERWDAEKRAYYFIKHGLNLLQYRDLACADLAQPIVVVLPDQTALEPDEKEFVFSISQADAIQHGNRVFGTQFKTLDEIMEYAETLDSVEKVEAAISDSHRVLFDTEWRGSLGEKIRRGTEGEYGELLNTDHPGLVVASLSVGRMGTSNELLIKSRRLQGAPLIDAPTSWQYFVWKLEYDATAAEVETHLEDLHIVKGLQDLADNEMQWLGKIPVDALIEVRRTGAIHEIREVLSRGIGELTSVKPAAFRETSEQVFDNLQGAFLEHQKKIDELRAKKWKFAGSDVGSWVVMGSLEVAAAATGMPTWGLAAIAAGQVLDAPKLKDIPQSIRELANESQRVRLSPVGMLFRYA